MEKPYAKKKRARIFVVSALALLALAIVVRDQGRRRFRVRNVIVSAPWPLNETQVRKTLPPLVGASLWDLQTGDILARVRDNRWVESAVVRKQLPDTLRIEVGVKQPMAVAPLKHGHFFLLDADGQPIERVTSPFIGEPQFPIVSWDRDAYRDTWDFRRALRTIREIQKMLGKGTVISQTALGPYPFFRLYLSQPNVEVSLSHDTWEEQVPRLRELLRYPWPGAVPSQISLLFPKKAIVSQGISK